MSEATICLTCLRIRQGLCDGEKGQTACQWYKRMTNADRIRQMTDEELAKWLHEHNFNCPPVYCRDEDCEGCWLDWLKQEVSDGSPKD